MKNLFNPSHNRILVFVLISVWVSLFSVPAVADETNDTEPGVSDNRFDVSFKGGSLIDLLEFIKNSDVIGINVIWGEALPGGEIHFPPLELKNVSARDLYDILNRIVANESSNRIGIRRSGNIWGVNYVANLDFSGPMAINFNKINDLLESYSLEAITTAIQTGWEMADLSEKSVLKFHPDTGILMFKSQDGRAIDITFKILNELRSGRGGHDKG